MATRLFTTLYDELDDKRRAELHEAIRLNLGDFDRVTVVAEDMDCGRGFPGIWVNWTRRQKFADLLNLASAADSDDVVIIANTDMVIQSTWLRIIGENLAPYEAYALTRWDVDRECNKKLFDRVYSQDVWAFRGPPKQDIGGDYYFGVPGVDNRFAHELDAAGYKVLNPSKTIRTYHLHLSGIRNGNKPENRVPGPYLFVKPHALGEEPEYVRPQSISKRASQYQR